MTTRTKSTKRLEERMAASRPEEPAPAFNAHRDKPKRVTLDLDPELFRKLKLHSVEVGRPMAEILRELLEAAVHNGFGQLRP